ncbi:MAG TPA: apolipoprotein N-acyltransferase [Ignavibacteriaceae bacterium]|nr:apolipoprotein N-acyltransferase [Ignavibacteriaceae bacterium]
MKLFNKEAIDPLKKKELRKDWLYLVLSGILLGISFPPSPFPYFLFAALIPFLIVINKRETLAEINRAMYLTAFIFSLTTIYWVGGFVVAKDPFLMISGFLLLFANPAVFLITSTLYYFAVKVFSRRVALFLFPFFWVTYEYAYMITDWSFPWITLGNGLSKFTLFIQIADLIGVLGLSLILVFINVLIYSLLFQNSERKIFRSISFAILLTLLLVPIVYGFFKLSESESEHKVVKVGLIQPDLDPYDKWSGGSIDGIVNEYLHLSDDAIVKGAEILFWPETALPVYLMSGSYSIAVDSIRAYLQRNDIPLLTGMPHIKFFGTKEEGPFDVKKAKESEMYYATYNSVLFLNPKSYDVGHYGKMKLVPFGERTPFVSHFPFLADLIKWGVGLSGWNVGQDTIVFSYPMKQIQDTLKVNGLICYESVYPDFVAEFCKRGTQLISVVTNDSWYGNTSGPYQHKEIAILRAVENRRYVVRAANGGISCIIDYFGRTHETSKMYEKAVVVGDVRLNNEITFFSKYPNLISKISVVIAVWIFGLFILKKVNTPRKKTEKFES